MAHGILHRYIGSAEVYTLASEAIVKATQMGVGGHQTSFTRTKPAATGWMKLHLDDHSMRNSMRPPHLGDHSMKTLMRPSHLDDHSMRNSMRENPLIEILEGPSAAL